MTATSDASLRVEFELSGSDLEFFRDRLAKARGNRNAGDDATILEGVAAMKKEALASNPPEFVKDRIALLDPLVDMLRDEDWKLEGEDRTRVLDALAYFADPDDLIPDRIPGIGYIDDAIMIDLVSAELDPELEAYSDFVAHRKEMQESKDEAMPSLDDARSVMQARMRRRRSRSRAGGVWRHATSFKRYTF